MEVDAVNGEAAAAQRFFTDSANLFVGKRSGDDSANGCQLRI